MIEPTAATPRLAIRLQVPHTRIDTLYKYNRRLLLKGGSLIGNMSLAAPAQGEVVLDWPTEAEHVLVFLAGVVGQVYHSELISIAVVDSKTRYELFGGAHTTELQVKASSLRGFIEECRLATTVQDIVDAYLAMQGTAVVPGLGRIKLQEYNKEV